MSSIIPSFEYDIFISYRQKDNKYDGWVTDFVDNLKKELEAAVKEDVSVYFDINSHDGLLETHEVGDSLKEKLKCLIFIPILSRTYCDPNSFAWQHECKAFIEMALSDPIGLKVRLPNGNIASRVLPVRIHDLDPVDIKQCESVLGSILRGVEFIYRPAGVNRPLRMLEEKPNENLNKTIYRDQINKVALAIKEILLGLKVRTSGVSVGKVTAEAVYEDFGERIHSPVKSRKATRQKLISGISIIAVILLTLIMVYPKIFKRDILEKLRSKGERVTMAILPFENLANDSIQFGRMAQVDLVYFLSGYPEVLRIQETESIESILQNNGLTNYATITPAQALLTARRLDADVFISGSVIKSGNGLRIIAKLTDTKTKDVIKSFLAEGSLTEDNSNTVFNSLSHQVGSYLLISKLQKKMLNSEE